MLGSILFLFSIPLTATEEEAVAISKTPKIYVKENFKELGCSEKYGCATPPVSFDMRKNNPNAGTRAAIVSSEKKNLEENKKPDKKAIVRFIKALWGDEKAPIMIRILDCESDLDPNAVNPELEAKAAGITIYSSWGVAQLNRPKFEGWDDYTVNLQLAYEEYYQKRGFRPWSCYTSGRYLSTKYSEYLPLLSQ